jgi:hypothetical protein
MIGMHKNFGVMTSHQHKFVPVGIQQGRKYGVDNNAFTIGFDPEKFFAHLEKLRPYSDKCLFIACPDIVGNARETLHLYDKWSGEIREYGPVAFVAQDGQENFPLPQDCDWLFIGGTTDFKMGIGAKDCIWRAQERGKPVHVGRVNSISRFRYFQKLGVDSVDGTNPIYEPDVARRRWTNAVSQLHFRNLVSSSHSSS